MAWTRRVLILAVGLGAMALARHHATSAQSTGDAKGPRFEFQVIESFDARYLGDTPGHKGRGGLDGRHPHVALGDPVYAGDARIGTVTSILWDRARESLEIEFDPEPKLRITVGEAVWVTIEDTHPAEPRRR